MILRVSIDNLELIIQHFSEWVGKEKVASRQAVNQGEESPWVIDANEAFIIQRWRGKIWAEHLSIKTEKATRFDFGMSSVYLSMDRYWLCQNVRG